MKASPGRDPRRALAAPTVAAAIVVLAMAVLAMAVPAIAAPCPPLTVKALNPSQAMAGDAVTFSGDGFCALAPHFFAWGTDGNHGFGFTVEGANQTELQARLGQVHQSVTGPVRLWAGTRIRLPDAIFETSNGTYHRKNASIFLPTERAVGPSFSAQAGSSPGFTSKLAKGNLVIDFEQQSSSQRATKPNQSKSKSTSKGKSQRQEQRQGQRSRRARAEVKGESDNHISVIVVLSSGDGEGSGCGPEPDPSSSPPPPRNHWVLEMDLDCFSLVGACKGNLAEPMAQILESSLSPLCVNTRSKDNTMVLSHGRREIEDGFVTVTPH